MIQDENPPSRVGDVLNKLIYQLGIDTKIKEMNVLKSWSEVVGEPISRHSQPVSISKGNLFVKVDSSAWLSQLSHFKEKIISEFNKRQGREVIKDIYFRVGRIYSFSSKRGKVRSRLSKVRLCKEDLEWIDKMLAKVKDENLKKLLKKLLSRYKRAQKVKENKKG